MKKVLWMIALLLCVAQVPAQKAVAGKIVFSNKQQTWVLDKATTEGDYTVVQFRITIVGSRGGCFDAHEYDVRDSEIYIKDAQGRHDLIQSTYKGNYERWEMYPGYLRDEYFEKHQKGKTAVGKLYFPKVSSKTISLHFNGGTADPRAPGDEVCPVFDVPYINLQ